MTLEDTMDTKNVALSWEQYMRDTELNRKLKQSLEHNLLDMEIFSEYSYELQEESTDVANCGYLAKKEYHIKDEKGNLAGMITYDENFNVVFKAYNAKINLGATRIRSEIQETVEPWGGSMKVTNYKEKEKDDIVPPINMHPKPEETKELEYIGTKIFVTGYEAIMGEANIEEDHLLFELPTGGHVVEQNQDRQGNMHITIRKPHPEMMVTQAVENRAIYLNNPQPDSEMTGTYRVTQTGRIIPA
jgi:hypothetical protein|tara:strand:- start:2609 stop:3343 length:735 start_codon:yes stop_codon:yes gene_type:complete